MSLGNSKDLGLLIIRLGLGAMMFLHGYPKILGGTEMWENLGGSMSSLGINFMPVFWGFLAAITETFGGICLALGLIFRPSAFLLFITMIVGTVHHLAAGDGIMGASHAIELAIVFIALCITGAGKYAIKKS